MRGLGEDQKREIEETETKIWLALVTHGALRFSELARAAGLSKKSLYRRLYHPKTGMIAKGVVRVFRPTLSPDGETVVVTDADIFPFALPSDVFEQIEKKLMRGRRELIVADTISCWLKSPLSVKLRLDIYMKHIFPVFRDFLTGKRFLRRRGQGFEKYYWLNFKIKKIEREGGKIKAESQKDKGAETPSEEGTIVSHICKRCGYKTASSFDFLNHWRECSSKQK